MREYIAAVVMIVFTSLSFWGMNMFGFQNNPHDVLWAIGAGLALLIIMLINVYIYFFSRILNIVKSYNFQCLIY